MNAQLVKTRALIAAAQTRVVGMQAANSQRLICGDSVMYSEDHFTSKAQHLEMLAANVDTQ